MQTATPVVPCSRNEIKLSPADEARFWKKVDKSGGPDACWLWTAGKSSRGYGTFCVGGKTFSTHRIAWLMAAGQVPHSFCVCHKCDVKICCNPSHFFLGTHADNMADKVSKNRQAKGDANGSRLRPDRLAWGDRNGSRLHPESRPRGDNHHARLRPECMPRGEANGGGGKLTAPQVLEIRARYAAGGIFQKDLASEYGVTQPTVGQIINRNIWRHI